VPYTILLNKKIKKVIEDVEEKDRKRLKLKLQNLSKNPTPPDTKKIRGKYRNLFRIRVGDLRILYIIDHSIKEIIVVKINKRNTVYR
jgi:mRNA-degrading endonuclease RelE of RelBE toxin-antitoxin system